MVVACTSRFHCGVLGRFSDSHTENCHRCNTIHLHLVLTPGLDDSGYWERRFTTETPSPNQTRDISRKGAKAAKKIRFPDLAFLASWRAQFSNSAPSAPPCETSGFYSPLRHRVRRDRNVFLNKISFTRRPQFLRGEISEIPFITETEFETDS